MIVHAGWRVTVDDRHTAGHAKMNNRSAVSCIDQQILCASADRRYRLTSKVPVDVDADRPAQPSFTNNEFIDAFADEVGLDATATGFDFGEFGHT